MWFVCVCVCAKREGVRCFLWLSLSHVLSSSPFFVWFFPSIFFFYGQEVLVTLSRQKLMDKGYMMYHAFIFLSVCVCVSQTFDQLKCFAMIYVWSFGLCVCVCVCVCFGKVSYTMGCAVRTVYCVCPFHQNQNRNDVNRREKEQRIRVYPIACHVNLEIWSPIQHQMQKSKFIYVYRERPSTTTSHPY